MRCVRQLHPRLRGRWGTNDRNGVVDGSIRAAGLTLADAREVIARWYGFEGWATLAKHAAALALDDSCVLRFESAVEAIITGDLAALQRLLRYDRTLVRARSTRAHHATLLHYVAANGVEGYRQKTPNNAVKIARLLLDAGAEVDADLEYRGSMRRRYPERIGSTTLGMAATSVHPAVAGLQIAILEALLDAGASVDGIRGGWNPVIAALHNGRGDAAAYLAQRGARLDLEAAAGVGRIDVVKGFFRKDGGLKSSTTAAQRDTGCMWACEYGHAPVVRFLLKRGVEVHTMPHGETGLHWAAYGGHADIVKLLLQRNANVQIREERWRNTPLGWALHGWCYPPPEAKRPHHHEVVAQLVAAGATIDPSREFDAAQLRKLKTDRRMAAMIKAARRPTSPS
jgi:ankyrin repeat protein